MPEAHEFREPEELIVRVWGMANDHAFFQNAHARDLTRTGATLYGIEHALQPEDIIGVQYGDKKARFRVAGVRDMGLPQRIRADVELLSGQECPWTDLAIDRAARAEPSPTPTAGHDKRRFPRLKVALPLEVRDDRGGGAPMQTATADASGHGCYVESLIPLPLGTHLHLVFWVESDRVATTGVVRTSDPGVGMGIEFVDLDDAAQKRLQKFLEKLAAESGNPMATS